MFTAPVANHTGRLLLTPHDPAASPHRTALIAALTACQFIGERLIAPEVAADRAFTVGDAFLELLAFTGCAVRLATATTATAFCHVRFPRLAPAPQLCTGRNTRPPRCPQCRSRLTAWPTASLPNVICPNCGAMSPLWRWDWKQQGGGGRRLILIEEIFPGEATPTDRLLTLLLAASGVTWRYFYVQD